jgi:LAO/AO transport system kinase
MASKTADDLVRDAKEGDVGATARLLTRVEASLFDAGRVLDLLEGSPRRGRAVGVFGPPGVGKSSIIAALIPELRAHDCTVAVLANDPTGARTGGALLGDRIRMKELSRDPGVFIRSVAARDPLRSLNVTTLGAVELLTRTGFDYVLVEAVGAGQSDLGTRLVADRNVLVLAPGLGDDVQAMKSGIMEVADVFVVNKADLPHSEQTVSMLQKAAREAVAPGEPVPPVLATTSVHGSGFDQLLASIEAPLERAEFNRDPRLATEVVVDLVCHELVRRVRDALPGVAADHVAGDVDGAVCIRAALQLADDVFMASTPA